MLLLMLPGVMLLLISLAILAQAKRAGGSLAWTEERSRATKRLWGALFAVACVIIFVMFGPAAMLAGWPFFVVAPALAFGCYKLADLAFLRKPRQERTIVHRDGSRAVVDARDGAGYRRLPAGEGEPRRAGLARRAWSWLMEG